jgi:RimJ/RimL family protein N-acetyltransferase
VKEATARVEHFDATNARAALGYLGRSPYENVFLTYVAIEGTSAMKRDLYIAFDGSDVTGIAFFGRQVVLAAAVEALPKLAHLGARGAEHAIVGPVDTVRMYWQLVEKRHAQPRLIRERQPVMVVNASTLRAPRERLSVRPAREDEWQVIADNSAAMIAGELETDPWRDPDFGVGIRKMIRLRLWWVAELDGRLCFFCNIGAWSPHTAQLQGIWTPPDLRGRGIANAALGAVCRELLHSLPTLSLYVNDFNAPALALYRRLGFEEVGALRTMLF